MQKPKQKLAVKLTEAGVDMLGNVDAPPLLHPCIEADRPPVRAREEALAELGQVLRFHKHWRVGAVTQRPASASDGRKVVGRSSWSVFWEHKRRHMDRGRSDAGSWARARFQQSATGKVATRCHQQLPIPKIVLDSRILNIRTPK